MYERLLRYLRCPGCGGRLELVRLGPEGREADVDVGLLRCVGAEHWFPVTRATPRMLPDALARHWPELEPHVGAADPGLGRRLRRVARSAGGGAGGAPVDERTRESFSREWDHDELTGRTWGMEVADRVRVFLLDAVRIAPECLRGKVVLDAGCGNGSQSVGYAGLGMEVIAIDLSDGVDAGQSYRARHPGPRPEHVHFVQGDLRHPPLAHGTIDLIHSVGVLHHTPDPRETFRALRPLLRDGGTFYVWLYGYEPRVTPLLSAIRAATTRVPARAFAGVAEALAPPYLVVRAATTALGIRGYPSSSRVEAAHALIDTFGSPHRHCHSFDEVAEWFRAEGFEPAWRCNEGRRGFGVCGRLPAPA